MLLREKNELIKLLFPVHIFWNYCVNFISSNYYLEISKIIYVCTLDNINLAFWQIPVILTQNSKSRALFTCFPKLFIRALDFLSPANKRLNAGRLNWRSAVTTPINHLKTIMTTASVSDILAAVDNISPRLRYILDGADGSFLTGPAITRNCLESSIYNNYSVTEYGISFNFCIGLK